MEVEPAFSVERATQLASDLVQTLMPGEQRLATVQHDIDPVNVVPSHVLRYPRGYAANDLCGYDLGTATPALIGMLVYITVVTGEIASTV
ncbi:hypothetical protein GCM10020216_088030 [Nonomuraea helvata]